jgi:hypothetical protein
MQLVLSTETANTNLLLEIIKIVINPLSVFAGMWITWLLSNQNQKRDLEAQKEQFDKQRVDDRKKIVFFKTD